MIPDFVTVEGSSALKLDPMQLLLPCCIGLAICILGILAMAKIVKKAGKPGWAAIVPFYNLYVLFEIAWGKGLLFLLTLIPLANLVVMIILWVKLAKAFGKGGGFAVGLVFLNLIFTCILGFGKAKYVGPKMPLKSDENT